MQKRKNRWYIAVAAVVILAVVLVLAVVLGKKGKNKKDPKMIEPTQQEQASEIPTETEEVFDYSATETAETKSLPKSVVSKQGILIDVDAGTILAGKDALKRMVPASMTKIFTVLVAAENIKSEQLDELVTISIDATDFSYSNDCSNTGYEVDEQVTVRDLFYGTILPSGADSAVSLATYVAGSQEAFVDMMNQELEKMGFTAQKRGTYFLADAICMGLENKEHRKLQITNDIYPVVAEQNGVSIGGVEKSIRDAIEHAWRDANLANLVRYYPFTWSEEIGRPTNAEFVSNMVERFELK